MFRKLFIVLSLAVVVFPDRGLRGVDVQPERHVTFKEECPRTYLLDPLRPGQDEASTILDRWIKAWPLGGSDSVDLSHRVILRLKDSRNLDPIVEETGLRLRRQVGQDVFILEARHALEAINLCETLSLREGVLLCHPERRRNHRKQGGYAPEPKDPYYREQGEINFGQWHLESRDPTTGVRNGTDINARVAWARSRGEGVVIGIVDDGVESGHPDLAGNGVNAWHYDFFQGVPGGENGTSSQYHGTQVAGLAAAVGDNGVGVSGVAPASGWVSMRIFSDSDRIAGEIGLADAFEYRIQEIPIQNHSWGNAANQFGGPGMLERMAIDNALQSGRGGLGVVMVRSGGNRAEFGGNVNDDGYANDPGVIAVGAVGDSGRVASYSSPGACVLVSGPSGDTGFKKLVTTDLSGTDGINNINFPSDLADYAYNSLGFSGTSGSSPIVAGVVALMLSVNPDLSVRDVQQILILSSGQTDTMNPNIRANGSGFPFSHLTGFGVPDAGLAVQLAEGWVARPAPMEVEYSSDVVQSVKDGGLTVRLQGDDVPVDLISIPASSGDGIVPDEPTAQVSLVDVGMASAEIMQDLTGKGALIQRG